MRQKGDIGARRCRKLNPKWNGVYPVVEVLMDGSVYVVENLFAGNRTQRAAGQVKPYYWSEERLVEPLDSAFEPDPVDEQLPPRVRRPPRKLIKEC